MKVEQIEKAALLAQKLDETARMPHHASWLVTELEDAAETITALLQLVRRLNDVTALQLWLEEQLFVAGTEWCQQFEERWLADDDVPSCAHFAALWLAERLGQTVALLPVPGEEG